MLSSRCQVHAETDTGLLCLFSLTFFHIKYVFKFPLFFHGLITIFFLTPSNAFWYAVPIHAPFLVSELPPMQTTMLSTNKDIFISSFPTDCPFSFSLSYGTD